MNENELRETMALLEAQGWEPMLCDTPVRCNTDVVSCR